MMFLRTQISWFPMLAILFRYFWFRTEEINIAGKRAFSIESICFLLLKEINELGARRIAKYGVPPIGCVPFQRTLAGGPLRNCAENNHNQATQIIQHQTSNQA